jgi:hypothetical protein
MVVSSFVKPASDGQSVVETHRPQKAKTRVPSKPILSCRHVGIGITAFPGRFITLSLISCRLNLTLMARRFENINPK